MVRRGNSEGSIYKRKDGRWAAAVSQTGAKRRTLYGKTRQEVASKLTAALRDKEAGLPVVSERQTIEQFLNQWLEAARPTVRHTTYVRYEEYVRLHRHRRAQAVARVAFERDPRHLPQLGGGSPLGAKR